MAKLDNRPEIPDLEIQSKETLANKVKPQRQKGKKDGKKKFSLSKVFREMISELKKVDWAPLKSTNDNSGVLTQTGTVLIVVLFFMIFIALFDTGLTKLLELLLESASPK